MSVDKNINNLKLKIKFPSGAEIELEGPIEFIKEQKDSLLNEIKANTSIDLKTTKKQEEKIWSKIVNFKDDIPYINKKTSDLTISQAILILLSSIKILKNTEEISAINLSKSLKLSGFNPKRLDRELGTYLKNNTILSTGTKRNRKYSINEKGIQTAFIKTNQILKELK